MTKIPKEIEELIDALLAKMKPNHTKEERNKFERHLMTSIGAYLSIPKEEEQEAKQHIEYIQGRGEYNEMSGTDTKLNEVIEVVNKQQDQINYLLSKQNDE